MESPPPPSQKQADEAQRARYAAENAILSLFRAAEVGSGSGQNEISILRSLRIAAILAALSTAIVAVSFRHPRDKSRSLLFVKPDPDQIVEPLLSEAQQAFNLLSLSELDDSQRAVLWSTWAHSKVADEIAAAINRGEIPHEFSDSGLKLKKVWISRSDNRVRKLHATLHGEVVAVDADFWRWPGTGQRLRWPGDKQAPPEATIGCRCVCLLTWADQDAVSETIRRITETTAPRD